MVILSMLLAIDIGNSNIVIGCIDKGEIRFVFRMLTELSKTDDEYAVGIKDILRSEGFGAAAFDGAIISSVVPPLTGEFRGVVNRLFALQPMVVGAGVKTGMNILIDDPATLGGDIVATSVAAMGTYKLPVVVIDLGTATTIAVVDGKGSYIGGSIFPGVALSMNALSSGTSQLPKVPLEAPDRCICANTTDAMKSGAIFGTASMIDGMIERFEDELGVPVTAVATGGLAPLVVPHCTREVAVEPNLLLRGLYILYEKNRKTA
jgi:type III pantothenate kinase